MFPKNIPLYKLDLTGKNPDNKVSQEYYRRSNVENETAFVLRSGPFYSETLELTKPDGTVLIEDKDYEIYGIASELTAFVKDKEVAMLIVIHNQEIVEWFAQYQVVGHFSIINRDLVNLINGAINDDRPVYYKNIKNKPLWFKPELHVHDIRYEIHSFTDLISCIKRIKDVKQILPNNETVAIDSFYSVILSHIEENEKRLLAYIRQHDSENVSPYTNDHGLTAKQVNLELVDNFETATLLNILDGFRKDLHVTIDLFKQALDSIDKETNKLVKLGTLPILRYGTNSFIPPTIIGSYEGMGGNNFVLSADVEATNNTLILMNRNDGRSSGLYFLRNTTTSLDKDAWEFTGHRYTHQTAVNDGIQLTHIVKGSNNNFLIVGGYNKNNTLQWYYALGNGTLNPDKHELIKLPDSLQGIITLDTVLIADMFPLRMLLVNYISDIDIFYDYNDIGVTFPSGVESIKDLEGIELVNGVMGMNMWEFDIEKTQWLPITFTYSQAYSNDIIKSPIWIPFRTLIENVSTDNPRADGADKKHGIRQSCYRFSKLISAWGCLNHNAGFLCKYDDIEDKLALKYLFSTTGWDERPSSWNEETVSIGVILKNRRFDDKYVYYDIENHKGLVDVTTMDVSEEGGDVEDKLLGKNDHAEIMFHPWTGSNTVSWVKPGVAACVGTATMGSLPMIFTAIDLAISNDLEEFSDQPFKEKTQVSYYYNETNAIGLTIGQHSTTWSQLSFDDTETVYAISYSTEGLCGRRQSVLDKSGYPLIPSKEFTYSNEQTGITASAIGYELGNDILNFSHAPGEIFCTQVFFNTADNNRVAYFNNRISHHAYPQPLTEGTHSVSNTTASFIFKTNWELMYESERDTYYFESNTQYNLEDAIKNTLLPLIKTYFSNNKNINFNAAIRNYRIGYTNVIGTTHDNLLLFTTSVVDTSTNYLYYVGVTFDLTKGGEVTPIGEVKAIGMTTLTTTNQKAMSDENGVSTFKVSPYTVACRDLVMQLSNTNSLVVMSMPCDYETKNGNYVACITLLVNNKGIHSINKMNTTGFPGDYPFVYHPYYGIVLKSDKSGAVEVGHGLSSINDDSLILYYNSNQLVLGNSNYINDSFTLYFSTEQDVILNGKNYTLEPYTCSLFDILTNPRNTTFYVYLDYNGSNAYYRVLTTSAVETPSRALIAIVKTNGNAIYEITMYNVFTMNSFRISTTTRGSAIPAAMGNIESLGQLENWVTQ